ncbi:hypothetical protein ACFFMN_23410 [Planobispora siamensis]|uniref:Uncharacterized protein n=1 Tax=Planobispora siamensis TaxID=936338 RepID=A0A8J3WP75_9ACTN|nr:hypothetical protein [Planobispora siamensis]GIH95312.1 hypothetical protein Psi01_59420 [Planobispora siamensis]
MSGIQPGETVKTITQLTDGDTITALIGAGGNRIAVCQGAFVATTPGRPGRRDEFGRLHRGQPRTLVVRNRGREHHIAAGEDWKFFVTSA